MSATVGIVIPAYEKEHFIEPTLRSLQHQDYADWECVVVDDGSRDRTADVAEQVAAGDSRIRVVRQTNPGVSGARNCGYRLLSRNCRYVTFMDGDDLWAPGALTSLVGACDLSPRAIGAHGLADMIDSTGSPLHPGGFAEFGRGRLGLRGGSLRPTLPRP
jgi:glycosyltransferase involved in cell wall biosynthesis